MFGRESSGLIRVYEYGCPKPPVRGAEEALEQMRLRCELWNRLVEINQATRKRQNDLLAEGPEEKEFDQLRKKLKHLRAELKSRRRLEPKSSPSVAALLNEVRILKKQIEGTIVKAKEVRKDRRELNRAALRDIETSRKDLIKGCSRKEPALLGEFRRGPSGL